MDVHLDLVGDGYLMDYYKTVAKDLGVEDYITFHGKKTREEISTILSNNDIFVVSSRLETFCIPGIEALASGLPIVSTSCLGPEEYIDEEYVEEDYALCFKKDSELVEKVNEAIAELKDDGTFDKIIDKYIGGEE